VFTDGDENTSREFSREQVADMTAAREKAGWTFIYMGANQDAWKGASRSGMTTSAGSVMNYSSTPSGTRAAMANTTQRASTFVADNASYSSLASSMGDVVPDPEEDAPPSGYGSQILAASDVLRKRGA
jgi:hypothetical protein